MKVKVSKIDISHGTRNSFEYCPVARAISRELNHPDISVSPKYIIIPQNNDTKYIKLPAKVRDFIHQYDAGHRNLLPFSFTLEIPETES